VRRFARFWNATTRRMKVGLKFSQLKHFTS
jgi:hypothetical protein